MNNPPEKRLLGALAALLLPLSMGCQTGPATTAEASRPNIVVIMADDMGYGDLGSYNPDSRIPTPNLDRLADEGMRFTDAHSPSGVCTPTRYALLTGRYAWRTPLLERGATRGYDPLIIDTTRLTLASLLKQQGYATAVVGKWHLGLGAETPTDYGKPLTPGPNALGFDYFYGIPASLDMPPYVYVENEAVVEAPTDSTDDTMPCCIGAFWRGGPMAPGFDHAGVLSTITQKAVDYIEERSVGAPEQPFFLYVPFSAPHTPWLPNEAFQGKSEAGEYGDFTMQVDASVGEIVEALDQNGLHDRTLLIVTSDNGAYWRPVEIAQYGHRSNHHWRGMKGDIHEGGHRVPFIARWPGEIPAGAVSDQVISHTDLMATFAAVVEAPLPPDAGDDSHNLLPVLRQDAPETPVREATVHQSSRGMLAIRQGPWKLIAGQGSGGFTPVESTPDDPPGQLYHLGDDAGETQNLYNEQPETVARLQALLDRYREQGRSRPPTE